MLEGVFSIAGTTGLLIVLEPIAVYVRCVSFDLIQKEMPYDWAVG